MILEAFVIVIIITQMIENVKSKWGLYFKLSRATVRNGKPYVVWLNHISFDIHSSVTTTLAPRYFGLWTLSIETQSRYKCNASEMTLSNAVSGLICPTSKHKLNLKLQTKGISRQQLSCISPLWDITEVAAYVDKSATLIVILLLFRNVWKAG